MEERWTYAKAGVDISREEAFVRALIGAEIGKSVRTGFASLVSLRDLSADWMLAISTDGVGSKILVAQEMRKWDTIGIDCVAMNVNDVLCVGAKPLCFVDYIAAANLDARIANEIGKGLREGARIASVSWVGGETAVIPEVVRTYDLSGTCVGIVHKQSVVPQRAEVGDLIIGIPSSGIHCNGLTLARKVIRHAGYSLHDPFPFNEERSIGEELLTPTRIYTEILHLLAKCEVHGLAHITGGGFLKLKRLSDEYGFEIYDPLPPQPIFEFVKECGNIEDAEMYRTFNCGMGFAVVIPKEQRSTALNVLRDAKVVGEVVSRKGIRVRDVVVSP